MYSGSQVWVKSPVSVLDYLKGPDFKVLDVG